MGLIFTQTSADDTTSSYVFTSTDANSLSFEMRVNGSFYDDSTGLTSSVNVLSFGINGSGSQPRFTTSVDINPGDFMSISYAYYLNGQPVGLTHQPGSQLATSLRLDKPDSNGSNGLGDDLIIIYNPNDSGNFDMLGINTHATNNDQYPYTGANHNATNLVTSSTLNTGNVNFSEIEALTGSPQTAYATFTGVNLDQKFAIRGQNNNIINTGYEIHVANIGTEVINSGARFNMTLGGAINPNTIPEPSMPILFGSFLIVSLLRRKK